MQHFFTKFNLSCYKNAVINQKCHPLHTYSTATKFTIRIKREHSVYTEKKVEFTWSLLR